MTVIDEHTIAALKLINGAGEVGVYMKAIPSPLPAAVGELLFNGEIEARNLSFFITEKGKRTLARVTDEPG